MFSTFFAVYFYSVCSYYLKKYSHTFMLLYSCSVTQSFAVMLIILRFSIPADAFYSSTATATAYVRPGLGQDFVFRHHLTKVILNALKRFVDVLLKICHLNNVACSLSSVELCSQHSAEKMVFLTELIVIS